MMSAQAEALRDEALDLIIAARSGHATTAELQNLIHWRNQSEAHAAAYNAALEIWEALGIAAAESVTIRDRQFAEARPFAANVSRRVVFVGAAGVAAAAVAVINPPLGLWPSVVDLTADYHTATGEQRTVAPGEGLSIAMNTATSINRRNGNDGAVDFEVLAGEATFRNANGAELVSVQVLNGTVTGGFSEFNVRRNAGNVVITCLRGAVEIACSGVRRKLDPGQQLAYSDHGVGDVSPADAEVVTAWQNGLLIFKNETFAHVLDEIRRYRRGKLFLLNDQLGQRRITMRIELARIEEVADYAQAVLGATVRRLPGGIVLLS